MRISAREACVKPHLRTRSDINTCIHFMQKTPTLDNLLQINKSHNNVFVNNKDNSSDKDCIDILKSRYIANDDYESQVIQIDELKITFDFDECDVSDVIESHNDCRLKNKTKDNNNYNDVCDIDRDNNVDYDCDNAVENSSDCKSMDCSTDGDWNMSTAYKDSGDCDINSDSINSADNGKNENCDKHIALPKKYRNIRSSKGLHESSEDFDALSDVHESADGGMTKKLSKKKNYAQRGFWISKNINRNSS